MNEYFPYPPQAPWYAGPGPQPGMNAAAYPGQYPPPQPYAAPVYPTAMQPPAGYKMPAAMPVAAPQPTSFLNNPRFIKGALIGAVAAYLLTNEKVQQGMIKASVKTWSMMQGGIEEMKERFRDAEAELHAAQLDE